MFQMSNMIYLVECSKHELLPDAVQTALCDTSASGSFIIHKTESLAGTAAYLQALHKNIEVSYLNARMQVLF